jgi:hypothetical protein
LLLTGARARRRETWRLAAQLACWVLSPWSKKTLTVDKLIKLPRDE